MKHIGIKMGYSPSKKPIVLTTYRQLKQLDHKIDVLKQVMMDKSHSIQSIGPDVPPV